MSRSSPPWLTVRRGTAPLLVSLPHTGRDLPAEIVPHLVSRERAVEDTDWWVDHLYDFAGALGATVVRTALSRTAIDVNRDPSGASLYPGQTTTALCPTETFLGEPLYRDGAAPGTEEIARRRAAWFDPYHAALEAEIGRLRALHPRVVLWDGHSIRSVLPRLFDGVLPHLNIGTNSGAACDPALRARVAEICTGSTFDAVLDSRFKGGWITRGHGRPAQGVHAVQLELAWRGYMDEPESGLPAPYDPLRAAPMRRLLETLLRASLDWAGGTGREGHRP